MYDMQDKNQMIVKDETEEAIKKDEQRGETTNVKAPEARTTGSRELTCKICNLDFNAKGTIKLVSTIQNRLKIINFQTLYIFKKGVADYQIFWFSGLYLAFICFK